MNVTERINKILFIMSYVSQNQGVPLEELAQAADMNSKQLEKELDFMLLIGKPPFRPDDYVDIYVDEDRRVYIDFDQMLNRPLRFTRPEAMALLLSLELLDPEVDPEGVTSLRNNIRQAIANSVDPSARLEDSIVLERHPRPVLERFSKIRQAIEERCTVRMQYYALMRDETSERLVRPYALMKRIGYWYLAAYCENRKGVRTFKFERILELELTDRTFEPPSDFDIAEYEAEFLKSPGRYRVEILFDKKVADWIKEEWPDQTSPREDGIVLTLNSETLEYPSRLALEYGGHAHVLRPPALKRKVRSDARAILRLYETAPAKGTSTKA